MICYCVNNKINNKKYIGITKISVDIRRDSHLDLAFNQNSNYIFHKALRKYGKYNFEFEWINDYTGLITYSELKEIEIDMINKYRSFINFENSNGYNMTLGGEGTLGLGKSVDMYDSITREKLAEFLTITEASNITKINPVYISQCCLNKAWSAGGYVWCYRGNAPVFNDNKFKKKRVNCWNLNSLKLIKSYNSLTEASKDTGVNFHSISKNCNSENQSGGEFIWTFDGTLPNKKIDKRLIPIDKYDLKTNKILESFSSISEAELKTGVAGRSIYLCLNGKGFSAGGFAWALSGEKIKKPIKNLRDKEVIKYCLITNSKLEQYKSASEAGRQNNIDSSGISKCCRGIFKSAGGFRWSYI